MTTEIQKPKFVDYSGLPVVDKEKAECFYCSRVIEKIKMKKSSAYGLIVFLCGKCQ